MLRTLTALMLFMLINVLTISNAATPAGVRIYNQAEASYFDTGTGQIVRIMSNIATLVVAPLLAVDVTQDQAQRTATGQSVYFPHTVVNTGNQSDLYVFSIENLPGDNGELEDLKVYLDENGDGQVSPGEVEITKTDLLQAGERIQVIIVGTVPDSAKTGDQYSIKLSITSKNDVMVKDSNTDTATLVEGAILRVSRQSDVDCSTVLELNDRSYYEIKYTNVGNKPPIERTVKVAGVPFSGVLIEEAISPYFQLLKQPEFFSQPSQGMLLVADPLGEWVEYGNWDGYTTISKLAVLMPTAQMKPAQSGRIGYTLMVSKLPKKNTVISQQAVIDLNGDGLNDHESNTSCSSVLGDNPVIKDRAGQDLQGTIFDSANLNPVPGVQVTVSTWENNAAAKPADDATQQTALRAGTVVATGISNAMGRYTLTGISPGAYVIKITPPISYQWASMHPPEEYYTFKVTQASYGEAGFTATGQTPTGSEGVLNIVNALEAATLDIPVDLIGVTGQISIDKQASTQSVAIGELVSYTVKVNNVSNQDLYALDIFDKLPAGFKYVAGTTKLNGTYMTDPVLTPSKEGTGMRFRVGQLPISKNSTLTYLTQVTALGSGSNGINTAYSQGYSITGLLLRSPTASARVAVKQTGVLSDRAILFGRLAMEQGCAVGTPEQQEQGYPLAGVRLYMEDGTYVVTDPNGQYSLYGLKPGVHVLKIDPHSVPDGLQFMLTDSAQAGDPDSRFVDLVAGDFQRADFVASCPQAETRVVSECTDPEPEQIATPEPEPAPAPEPVPTPVAATTPTQAPTMVQKMVKTEVPVTRMKKQTKRVEHCEDKPIVRASKKVVTRSVPNPVAPIHFDSGKASIPAEYIQKLNQLVTLTRDKQNVRFKFVGHTDNEQLKPATKAQFGTNQGLSEKRAQEVAEFVLKNLAVKTQISVDGKGDINPIASNDTPEGMAQNRRVELVMIYDETVEQKQTEAKRECTTEVVTTEEPYTETIFINKPVMVAVAPAPAPVTAPTPAPVAQPRPAPVAVVPQPERKPVCTSKTITENSPVLNNLLARTKTSTQGWNNEVQNLDPANVDNLKNLSKLADKNGDISNGLMEAHRQQVKNLQESFAQEQSAIETQKDKEPQILDPKEAVKNITAAQAKDGTWLWPLNDTSLDGRFMAVVRSGVDPVLSINGKAVSSSQLGEQIVNKREKAQIMAWYGVELQEGENVVKIAAKDSFGNERTLLEKTFKRPSAGVAIKMSVKGTLMADGGRSTVPVDIEVQDINGYPAKGTYFVTLEASDGTWAEPDIQDKIPGHQVKVTNGQRTVHLRSSSHSSEIKLSASSGTLQSEADLSQIAEMRPLVAVGLLDLRASKGYRSGYENLGIAQLDENADGATVNGRAALFMKGRIKGDMHLTMAYDSTKDAEAELLRDINPAEYYRVYGDSSQRGFEAQSRSKLYAKLEKDRHSVMWGDYITDNEANGADIARTSRTLTGLNGIYDDGTTRMQVFAANQKNLRGYEEIPGNGTAMFYRLRGAPIVRNSEVIELVTRDRENSGLVLNVVTLKRFENYTLDEYRGDITFHHIIPTVDDELNPIFVRISYDSIEQGDDYLVAGVRVLHRFTDELSAGVSYTQDQNAKDGHKLTGVFGEYKTADIQAQAGVARMDHANGKPSGTAVRVQASKKWEGGGRTEFTAAQADVGFTNNSGGVIADRREVKLSHEQKLSKSLEGKVELTHSESLSTAQQRQSAEVSVTTQLDDWKLKGGVRQIRQSDDTTSETVNTAIVGVERKVELLGRKGSVKAEYEREIGNQSRQRASVGADMQLSDKTKAYIRYDQSDRLSSGTLSGTVDTQNSLVAGVKTQVLPSTELYSEYRIKGDITGEDVVAVSGAKANLELEKNLTVTPGIEFMNYMKGSGKSDAIAASVGISDTRDENAKKLLRLETRQSDTEKYYGANATYVQKLDESTTVMVQDELRYQDNKDSGKADTLKNTLTLAAAVRPQGNGDYNALYAYKWDKDDSANTNTHILSTHQNYQVNEDIDVSGRLGAKRQTLQHDGKNYESTALLADARAQWDLNDRLGLDVHGGLLATNGAAEKRYAFGAGFAYNLVDNVRLGAGYNFTGFDDKDLDPEAFNAQGAYIGLQVKADEALFGWLTGDEKPGCQSRYMAERDTSDKAQRDPKQDDCNTDSTANRTVNSTVDNSSTINNNNSSNELKAADHEKQPVE